MPKRPSVGAGPPAPGGAGGEHAAPRAVLPAGVAGGGPLPGFGAFAGKAGDAHVQESTELFNAALANDLATVKKNADAGGDVNVIDLKGVSPLILAVHNQNLEMVKFLLSKKANPNHCSTNSSPVHEAVKVGSQPILDFLLGSGGNINLTTDFGKTPIHTALQVENEALIDYLIGKKANLKAMNDGQVGCVHFAAAATNTKIMEKFLAMKDININERNGNGKTPLHIAAEKNNFDMIKILLNRGADNKIKDGWGRLAEECGKNTAYHLIHDHVAGTKYEIVDPDAPEKKGAAPLFDVGDIQI
jgi:ankyrin repeat protein